MTLKIITQEEYNKFKKLEEDLIEIVAAKVSPYNFYNKPEYVFFTKEKILEELKHNMEILEDKNSSLNYNNSILKKENEELKVRIKQLPNWVRKIFNI